MKILVSIFSLFFVLNLQAQLKVGNNPKTISSNSYFDLESTNGNRFVISKDSAKVGIGTIVPTNKLHVKDTVSYNPLRIEGLMSGNTASDSVLMINALGVVRRNSASFLASTNEPWYSKTTAKGALSNTDTIYHLGMVGIGTNSPSVGLHIRKSTMIEGADGSKYPLTINLGEDGIAYGNLAENRGMKFTTRSSATSNTFLSSINSGMLSTGGTATDRYMSFNVKSDTNIVMFLTSTNGGMVGLGTTNPTSRIHIKDSVNFNPLRLEGLVSGSAITDSILVINSAGAVRRVSSSTLALANEPWFNVATNAGATSNTQNIYQMGKVGINVNNPAEQFEVNGNIFQRGYTYLKKTTGNTAAFIWTNFNSGGDAINYSFNFHNADGTNTIPNSGYGANSMIQQNAGIFFRTTKGQNNTIPTYNALAITSSSKIGVNTTAPTTQLHVIDSSGNGPLRLEGLVSGAATDSVLVATSNGTVRRLTSTDLASANEPWYSKTTSKGATSNTDTIYYMGRVGIGTNAPLTPLTVDNSGTTGTLAGTQALFRDNGAGNAIIALQTKGVRVAWYGLDRSTSTMYWNNDGTGTANALSNAKMVLNSSGNFGLGTTTPGGALTLYGSSSLALPSSIQGISNASKEIVFSRGGVTTGLAAITAVDNGTFGGGLSFLTKASNSIDNFPTSAIQSMVIDWNGRVGIGTGNPNWLLDVQTNSNTATQTAQFVNVSGGTSAESHIGIGAGPGAWARLVGYNGTLGIRNYSTGTELMTIKTGGNIGIGTTAPGYPLHIRSSNATSLYVETTSGDPNGAMIINVPSSNTVCGAGQLNCSEFIMFQLGGSNIGNITPNGSGTATVYNTTSDLRLKENIFKTQFSIADLMKMNVVDYNYKMDKNKNKEIGFIAQELYKIIPSAVKQGSEELDDNGMPRNPWMIDYSKLTPIVIKAAQDLKKENEEQQAIINKQSQKIDELMKRLEALEAKIK